MVTEPVLNLQELVLIFKETVLNVGRTCFLTLGELILILGEPVLMLENLF